MKKLIIETQDESLIAESSNDDKYTLKGVFSEWDKLNNNKRTYLKDPLLREVKKLQTHIDNQRLVGEMDHPPSPKMNLDRISHKVVALEIDENNKQVLGKVKLLDTRLGKDAKALVDGKIKIAISSRAIGEVTEKEDGTFEVGDSLNMITYDLVMFPGVDNAILRNEQKEEYVVLTQKEYESLIEGRKEDAEETIEKLRKAKFEKEVIGVVKDIL